MALSLTTITVSQLHPTTVHYFYKELPINLYKYFPLPLSK